MKQTLLLVLVISILTACNSDTTKNKSEDQKAIKQESSVTPQPQESEMISKNEENEKGITKIAPAIESASGEKPIEGGDPEAEDESLRLRRAQTQFKNGTVYYKDGEIQKAIDAFKLSLEYKPDNDRAFYNLGKIYYELGQKDLAMTYYMDAVSINENDSLSLVGVGLVLYEKAKYPEALEYYNRAIDVAPQYAMAYFNRGTMLGQNRQYDQALLDLTNAIKYDPTFSESYINRGLAYFYKKDLDNACKDWQIAADMGNPKGADAIKIYCNKKK